ncbi:MAG: dimethylarginine dimethylaminohydrolase family protein [Candidatus Hodarchaeales archaeon]
MLEFGATCEYYPLRKVLMYRPGIEITQVTKDSYQELTFRDVVYWRQFQREHDAFCELLRGENIEVILLNDLLEEQDFSIIDPNMVYTRDTGAITDAGFVQMRMAHQVRRPETTLVARSLLKLGISELVSINAPGLLEGGDFVYPDEHTLMIGSNGIRTNEEGISQVTKAVLRKNVVNKVVYVPLPSWRVHLDGGLMFVDKDLFIYHPASVETFPLRIIRGNEPVEFVALMDFIKENYDAEGIAITDNELYLFGANVVCLDRRKVVVYEWNERIISELRDRSVEVLSIQGGELSRGGGGPHCMTLPILRKK